MLLERFENVKIMTATVTFEFVDWHGVYILFMLLLYILLSIFPVDLRQ